MALDRRLTFHKHVSTVARSCNNLALVIRHIRHLLTTELAQTLACSLILSRVDYCNALLHGAPNYSIKKLKRVQNNAARIVLQEPRRSHAMPLLKMLHWLPIQQWIDYKVALLTSKVRSTSTLLYIRRLIKDREHVRNLRSATTSLSQPSPILLSLLHLTHLTVWTFLVVCNCTILNWYESYLSSRPFRVKCVFLSSPYLFLWYPMHRALFSVPFFLSCTSPLSIVNHFIQQQHTTRKCDN